MKKYLFFLCAYFVGLFMSSQYSLFAGDSQKTPPVVAAPKDMKEEMRKKDSTAYYNLAVNAGTYEYQEDTNVIMLPNGLKLTFQKITRLNIPRGITVTLPDTFSQRSSYELAEMEISATNTTSSEIKLDGSEPVFVSLKLLSPENNWKGYASQYSLSFGSVYLKMEPQQTEKMNTVYAASHEFLDKTYKAGQTKTFKGIIVPIPRTVRHFDHVILYTREFGQNRSYGCPARL